MLQLFLALAFLRAQVRIAEKYILDESFLLFLSRNELPNSGG